MNNISAKKIITNTLWIILSIIFSLCLGEVLLRIIWPQPLYSFEKGLFINSKEYGYCLASLVERNHRQPEYHYKIKSNSYGFRGSEPNFNAKFRILILGDSFGMGQGVGGGKNFCELSQSYFDKQGMDTNIFNTSIGGYCGINEVKVLKRFIDDYKPNLVILLFSRNDIGPIRSLVVQNGYLVLNMENNKLFALREWLNNHSHLYCLIKRFYYGTKHQESIKKGISVTAGALGIKNAVGYVLEMKKICDAYKVPFTVVICPLAGSHKDTLGDMFNRNINDNSVYFVDWASFLPKQNKERLFYKIDGHLTEEGNAYFSKYLNQLILTEINKNN